MKKLIFVFAITLFLVGFTSCSSEDSADMEPQIVELQEKASTDEDEDPPVQNPGNGD